MTETPSVICARCQTEDALPLGTPRRCKSCGGAVFISMERPTPAVFARARHLAKERNWKAVTP